MSTDYLNNPEQIKRAAQAIANAGLYKAGDSLDYKKQKEKGLFGIVVGVVIMIITLTNKQTNNQPITGMIGMVGSLVFGIRKHKKGAQMQKVLEFNGIIRKKDNVLG